MKFQEIIFVKHFYIYVTGKDDIQSVLTMTSQ
jgi:hypothetical protein